MDFRSWCLHYFPGGTFTDGGDHYSCKNHLRGEKNSSLSFWNSGRWWNDFGAHEDGKISEFCREHGLPEWDGAPEHREERKPLPAPNDKASEARRLWEQAKDAINHPYLSRKKIDGQGCRVTADGTLLVPAYTLSGGDVVGVERIDAAGSKKHLGTKGGAFFPCGDVKDGKTVLIAEGFATAKSIHAITGFPTLAAFGAVNLLGAAQSLRGREVLICPDADDAGRKAAAQCRSAGFKVVELPPDSRKGLDWNDVHVEQGLEPAKALFKDRWSVAQAEKVEDKASLRSFRQNIEPTRGQKPEMIGGIFPRGGVSVVAGQQGAGKSMLMQKFCSDVSLGGEILDGVSGYAAKRKTVYFVGELPVNTMNDRQRTAEWRQNPDNLILYSRITIAKNQIPLDLDDGEGFRNVAEIIMDEKPDLVVFDSLMSFLSCDESDMKAMQGAFTKMVRLADDLQCAVVVVHHIRKKKALERASRLHMDDIIGSSIITRNASLAIGAEKLKTDDGEEMVYVSNLKSWYAPLDQFAFRIIRDDYKVFRGIEIELNPKNPAANKTEAIENAVFKGHADGSDFTVAGIAKVTGATDRYVRKLFREWEEAGRIVSKGGSKNTSYSIMQKFRNDIQSLGMTEKDSGTSVPESSGILEEEHCANCIPELPVPESFPVIATAQGAFRNYPMITGGDEKTEVYNPSDGEPRQGNLEQFFPGGFKTGPSSPRGGPSIEDLSSRAGVSVEAIRESLSEWESCGRVSLDDDGTIHLLAGTSYPGQGEDVPEDEDEPPVSAPKGPPKTLRLPAPSEKKYVSMKDVSLSDAEAWAQSVPGLVQQLKAQAAKEHDPVMERSARDLYESLVRIEFAGHLQKELDGEASGQDHIPDAGKKVLPGQAALLFPPEEPPAPATPPVLKDEEPSTPRGEDRSGPPPGWLEEQPEAVQSEYRAKVKRLKGVDMPDYEAVALLRTWEEFRGRR